MTHLTDPKIKECLEACNECHQICLHETMNHCLEIGGEHIAPDHIRLMLNCATICQASVDLMLSRSVFSYSLCKLCAEVCEECARSCERLGMDECAKICRECARSCKIMAA